MALKVVGRISFELECIGSSSPTGIRILAQGCRSRAEATLGTPDPNGVASVPESISDVLHALALAMKPQKLPVFVLKCTFAVMFLLVVNILGHYRKLAFGNGEATVTGLP
ncbi:MAG: hypothetical protein IZT59_04480 [Verrucomicrobia bacterium]|jgi:hypothetical protein|nr:hypothetical protein [Verrucomicrobiota bacterium]|tara:strand:- start:1898 stop:2227 length:330 start_codon:yes stop_codon:yes gene_type:complete